MAAEDAATIEGLARRVARLEAVEEIRKLKLAYATLCDDGYPGAELAALFTEDAVFEAGEIGRYEGRGEIQAFFDSTGDRMTWAIHFMTNDGIEVAEGLETATGTWYLPNAVTLAGDGGESRPMWIFGIERDTYRRAATGWLIAETVFSLQAAFDSRVGWHEDRAQL